MREDDEAGRATLRIFAVAAVALLGLAFSATPLADRLDAALLDFHWGLLRKFDPRPAPDDIIIVGIDEQTFRAINEPLAMWHAQLGKALALIASAKPRAIGLDVALPERSYDAIRAGLDRALLSGLVAARESGVFVGVISIDASTRDAKPIFPPFLAVLSDQRLSLGMLSRDVDGVTRRFSLMVPTEDGGYPTLAGRMCRALSKGCGDGLIHYALGGAYRYVPMHQVLESRDPLFLDRLFRDRIVMIGETQRFSDRVDVPVNLAGWERGTRTSPGVVVHAQALRTALQGAAPVEAARPIILILVTLAASLALMRDWRLGGVVAALAAAGLIIGAAWSLRGGIHMPVSAALFTVALAWSARTAFDAWRHRRARERLRLGFSGYVSPGVLKEILGGRIPAGHRTERLELAFVFADLRGSTAMTARSSPEEAMALLNRFHEVVVSAVHRNDGMLDNIRGDGVMAIFGAPKRLAQPCRCAWDAIQEIFRGLERLNAELAREGKPALEVAVGAAFGEAVVGHVGSSSRFNYTAIGDGSNVAARLQEQAKRRGCRVLVDDAFRECLGPEATLAPVGTIDLEGHLPVKVWTETA